MNPVGYPAEAAQMQMGRYDGFSGQPERPAVVQFTTVNIITDPPQDYIIWSIVCFVYTNPCCLGLAALIYSIKARDRRMAGDLDGARNYGSTARCLNMWATILGSLTIIIIFTAIILILRAGDVHIYFRKNSS